MASSTTPLYARASDATLVTLGQQKLRGTSVSTLRNYKLAFHEHMVVVDMVA